ncbi:MAG TPA: PD-(D/E)XK nuclease family protein [Bryobacteraceae bacterium]|nr:PD-(D/E)XK nuclease family protein [Bryobacteraceae bacterium]
MSRSLRLPDSLARRAGEFTAAALAILHRWHRHHQEEEAPAAAPAPAPQNDLGALLSPSQVRTYLDCPFKWWAKYGLGLPDPPNGSFVRGRVVHRLAEMYYRARLAGQAPDVDALPFEETWDLAAAQAAFGAGEDVDLLKRQAAALTRMYLDQIAAEVQPAAVETPVAGAIAGVAVRGIIDVLDVHGRIIDLKTAARTPAGVAADYAFQVATYRQLEPRASGTVQLATLVATKTPKIVTQTYTVQPADLRLTETLYPLVREGIRNGLYLPNRGSNLCSRKHCNFATACEAEFGGCVKGQAEE